MALQRVWMPSPSRGGTRGTTRILVVHTAEGARDFRSLGNFFANRNNAVSSHTGIDNTPGVVGEYVEPNGVAWTQASFNGVASATELCAFAAWDRATWLANDQMLRNCGQWIAEECARYHIPLVKLNGQQAQGGGRGVCGHVELGAGGGGHWDPGPGFPWDIVMSYAGSGEQEEDLTEDQANQLREIFTRVVVGVPQPGDALIGANTTLDTMLRDIVTRVAFGTPEPSPANWGALGTLDSLLRDITNRLERIEARLGP